MNEKGALVPANIFDKVTYHLHPSFGERATQGMFGPYCVFDFWVIWRPRLPRPRDQGCGGCVCVVFRLEANVGRFVHFK